MAQVRVGTNPLLLLIGAALCSTLILYPFGWGAMTVGTYLNARKRTRQVGEAAKDFLRDFIGAEPRFMDAGCGGYGADLGSVTGTGIAYADGRLYVLEEGTAAEIHGRRSGPGPGRSRGGRPSPVAAITLPTRRCASSTKRRSRASSRTGRRASPS